MSYRTPATLPVSSSIQRRSSGRDRILTVRVKTLGEGEGEGPTEEVLDISLFFLFFLV